jgi:hypothetical protein
MYEFQCLREIFDQLHKPQNDSDIKTTEDLDDLYSRIKLPDEDK